jgi:hypothetical protein
VERQLDNVDTLGEQAIVCVTRLVGECDGALNPVRLKKWDDGSIAMVRAAIYRVVNHR